jgi:hypothetical protein
MQQAPEIWNFHPMTGVLLRTAAPCYADPDPELPGSWLYPGCTSPIEPGPDIDGKLQKIDLDAGQWIYIDQPEGTSESTPATGNSSPEELAATVQAKRDQLMQRATLRISPLQDAKDLGVATEQEEADLLSWKQYRIALNRISQQPGYPQEVAWPTEPGATA